MRFLAVLNQRLLEFAQWLAERSFSVGLHESLYLYNWIETAHVLTLAVSLGALSMIDLRLLGWCLTEVPASQLAARLKMPMVLGFAVMFATGLMLFSAIPVRTVQSLWFRIKMGLLVAAAINAWLFHRYLAASGGTWDRAPLPPWRARLAAGISLALWAGVIMTGRFIAYDWFDCGQDNPALVDWAAGCMPAELG